MFSFPWRVPYIFEFPSVLLSLFPPLPSVSFSCHSSALIPGSDTPVSELCFPSRNFRSFSLINQKGASSSISPSYSIPGINSLNGFVSTLLHFIQGRLLLASLLLFLSPDPLANPKYKSEQQIQVKASSVAI